MNLVCFYFGFTHEFGIFVRFTPPEQFDITPAEQRRVDRGEVHLRDVVPTPFNFTKEMKNFRARELKPEMMQLYMNNTLGPGVHRNGQLSVESENRRLNR